METVMQQPFWIFFGFFFPLFIFRYRIVHTWPSPAISVIYTALVLGIAVATGVGFLFDSKIASFLACAISAYLILFLKK